MAAFWDDPLYSWLFPDALDRLRALTTNFDVVLDAGARHGHIVTNDAGTALMLWTDPGAALFDDPAVFDRVFECCSPRRRAAAFEAMEACSTHQPPDAIALHLIGVVPGCSGTGVGSTLLRRLISLADRTATSIYLDSSNERNHRFYERLGFAPVGTVDLSGGGPRITPMLRTPAA